MPTDESPYMHLARLVQGRRRELGLSVREIAKRAGIDRNTWSVLESGHRRTRDDKWTLIEDALGWEPGSIQTIVEGERPGDATVSTRDAFTVIREMRELLEDDAWDEVDRRAISLFLDKKEQEVKELRARRVVDN